MESRGVRHGGFRVLQLTSMPSVLIEAGFLSNKKDKKRLTSKKGQRKIASKIFRACLDYFGDLNEIETQASASSGSVVKYHPMPQESKAFVEKENEDALLPKKNYSIQIASYNNVAPINVSLKWQDLTNIKIVQEGRSFKYFIGNFTSKNEAELRLKDLIKKGFQDAFIVVSDDE